MQDGGYSVLTYSTHERSHTCVPVHMSCTGSVHVYILCDIHTYIETLGLLMEFFKYMYPGTNYFFKKKTKK